jgi:hypothetical protein
VSEWTSNGPVHLGPSAPRNSFCLVGNKGTPVTSTSVHRPRWEPWKNKKKKRPQAVIRVSAGRNVLAALSWVAPEARYGVRGKTSIHGRVCGVFWPPSEYPLLCQLPTIFSGPFRPLPIFSSPTEFGDHLRTVNSLSARLPLAPGKRLPGRG